ncbi:sensor histidine kinase [Actinoplanes bogorensis]|uniref:Oxygen sensor histidine kinase NreB n=1 Tax=Paractinoplanes bogorensis TaxID=1610840 RepID=A0ABS5YTN8_9ACTN|nr:sensor histidine kinase [Actinoplanes bogorensis]MBU2666063.1 sensor histidine kinase [Actinoplanes bogorensis]
MKRAMAAFTVAAFLTLLVDVGGGHREGIALLPGLVFTVAATLGFGAVERRTETLLRYAYVAGLVIAGFWVFHASAASVGSTLMLVVLVIQATLLLPPAAVAITVVLLPFFHAGMALSDGLREGLGLLAVGAFAAVVTTLLMREQQARAALAQAQLQVERLAAFEERNRVARDIHDGLGHALTVVQMQIKAARAAPDRAEEMLAKAQEQTENALREVRRSVGALREERPPVPLVESLRELAATAPAPTSVEVRGAERPLPPEAGESLFRAAQEGLTNVGKHAQARSATILVDYSHSSRVRLEVRDDGVGATGDTGGGFGLIGLRERAAQLGGSLTLDTAPGAGATLRMEVPG